MIDLAIAYRVYPGVSRTPAVWSDDKLKLAAYCLSSFKRSLGPLRVKLWALLDGCPPSYEALFRQHFNADELVVLNLNSIGNQATFSIQLDLLTKQTECDLVYFAEDDYVYIFSQRGTQYSRRCHSREKPRKPPSERRL